MAAWSAAVHRRLGGWRASGLGAGLLLSAALTYPYWMARWVLPEYELMHQANTGIAVFDQQGRYIGIVPPAMIPGRPYRAEQHAAIEISHNEIPAVWWAVLIALEDRHLGTWRSVGGIDIGALGTAMVRDWPRGRFRGASTLPMMLVRSLHHDAPSPRSPLTEKLGRKLREWRDAPILVHALGTGPNSLLAKWLAMHVPLVQGTPGSRFGAPVYGLVAASYALWGVPPVRSHAHPGASLSANRSVGLSPARQAMLAAAFWRPVLLAPRGANRAATEAAMQRWRELKHRAASGLRYALAHEPEALRVVLAELTGLALPAGEYEPFEGLTSDIALRQPSRRAATLAYAPLREAVAQMQQRRGRDWYRSTREITLTLDVRANHRFEAATNARLRALGQARNAGLTLDAVRYRSAHRAVTPAHMNAWATTTDFVAVVVNSEGKIVRINTHGHDSPVLGRQAMRAANGRYLAERETQQLGSVSKLFAAIEAARVRESATMRYCNAQWESATRSYRNAQGDTGFSSCEDRLAWEPIAEVFARSRNLPIRWRLQKSDPSELRAQLSRAGMTIAVPSVDVRTALAFGMVAARPAATLGLMGEIGDVVAGRGGTRQPVSVIDKVTPAMVLRGQPGATTTPFEASSFKPSPFESFAARPLVPNSPQAARLLGAVLSAPLRAGGTAARLGDIQAQQQLSFHLAKTGTIASEGHVHSALLVGAFGFRGQTYAYLVQLSARQPSGRIPGNPHGGHLAPIARAAIESIVSRPADSK